MLLYRAFAALALAAYAPWAVLRRALGGRRVGDLRGRLGRVLPPDLSGGVWIHAVSVGEVGVAAGLFAALHRRLPGVKIGVSTTTAAGREVAERTFAGRAPVFAFPFDLAGPVERALNAARPSLVILTETEIWPLFIERAARRGIRVALVNGRISERSFARYRLRPGPPSWPDTWSSRVVPSGSHRTSTTRPPGGRRSRPGSAAISARNRP